MTNNTLYSPVHIQIDEKVFFIDGMKMRYQYLETIVKMKVLYSIGLIKIIL